MKKYRVRPGQKIALADFDPEDKSEFSGGKKDAVPELADLAGKLDKLQELLYAEHKNKILIVLQGLDTAGKDGVVRSVFSGVNPEGVHIANFKIPTPIEQDHDFLWRVHPQVPGRGELVVFNRSYYEDVLAVRVHKLVSESVWRRRYTEINHFESLLVDEGSTLLKL